jgi:glutathione synthase/RimK-type ligase-like ATP-grasp enzyme
VLPFLKDNNIKTEAVIWTETSVPSGLDAVIVRSPWDYYHRHTEFLDWFKNNSVSGTPFYNSSKTVIKNYNKIYLRELMELGVKIPETAFIERGGSFDLNRYFREGGGSKLVIKPLVSGGAHKTTVVTAENLSASQKELNEIISETGGMVQEFLPQIHDGELSFLFFNGKYSHTAIKIPAAGDFRVQNYYGGVYKKYPDDRKLIAEASEILRISGEDTLYARVDGLVINGKFNLIELEIFEPALFLHTDESAAVNFGKAILERLY